MPMEQNDLGRSAAFLTWNMGGFFKWLRLLRQEAMNNMVRICHNGKRQYFEVWMTPDEDKKAILKALKPKMENYKTGKLKVVFFVSGTEDLKENTAELLRSHRRSMVN